MLRYAQRRRFSQLEQKRIENEIGLQSYLRTLIQTDKERRMQARIEKYLEENHLPSATSPMILSQYRMKSTDSSRSSQTAHVPSTTTQTTTSARDQRTIDLDPDLEQALNEIEFSSEQSLNEVNHLFNEVDIRRKRREIPEYLTCKLCYDLMRDPVITPCKFIIIDLIREKRSFSLSFQLELLIVDLVSKKISLKLVISIRLPINPWSSINW